MHHIAIIGIDGCGKTTIIRMLERYFVSLKMHVRCSNLKGENYYLIKHAAKNNVVNRDSVAIACAFDLYKHYMDLANNNSDIVLWDRFSYCIEASNPDYIFRCIKDIIHSIPEPEYTFYLDVDPQIALQRIQCRAENIKSHENYDYLQECRTRYLLLKENYDFICIDASQNKSGVFGDIISYLRDGGLIC